MRAEEKELEGPELEREQSLESMREAESEEEQLPEIAGEQQRDAGFDSRSRLFDALQLILAGEEVNITLLYLPQRETHALETLQAAVKGSDEKGEFVFAEDRRSLLEQSLAVLQQNVTYGDPAQMAALQSKFDGLVGQVGELRAQLVNLEDAQEEIEEWHNAHERGFEPETDDKPKPEDAKPDEPIWEQPEPVKADAKEKGGIMGFLSKTFGGSKSEGTSDSKSSAKPEAASRSSSSSGPDVAAKPSTLSSGPDVAAEKKPSSLSGGPDVVPESHPSSLTGGPDVITKPQPSSLTGGPDIGPAKSTSSSLYDPDDPRTTSRPTETHDPAPQRRVLKAVEPLPPKKP